eukprot:1196114-Prorocentrum_minimum.AAC.3
MFIIMFQEFSYHYLGTCQKQICADSVRYAFHRINPELKRDCFPVKRIYYCYLYKACGRTGAVWRVLRARPRSHPRPAPSSAGPACWPPTGSPAYMFSGRAGMFTGRAGRAGMLQVERCIFLYYFNVYAIFLRVYNT